MASGTLKREASRRNGAKSRGPLTPAGKARSSRNALTFGILSRELILPDENVADYQALFDGLCQEMRPRGVLEQILVERIAVALWRQRRLVAAETAQIELHQRDIDPGQRSIQRDPRTLNHRELVAHMLSGDGLRDRHQDLDAELVRFSGSEGLSLTQFQQSFPMISGIFRFDGMAPEITLAECFPDLNETIADLREAIADYRYARSEDKLRHKAFGVPKAPDLIARYQSALDNDLYKAMRALREAQSWRIAHIEAVAGEAE